MNPYVRMVFLPASGVPVSIKMLIDETDAPSSCP